MKKIPCYLTGLIMIVLASRAWADTSWTGAAADNNFNNAADWTAGVPNSATNANLTGASGETLVIGANVATGAAGANLDNPLVLDTSSGVTLSIGGDATFTGNGALTKSGAGTLTLSGATNQFSSFLITGGVGNQLAGATSLSEFAVGTGTTAGVANTGSFILSSGSIKVDIPSSNSPTPSFRVGDFGGTGTFTQEAGTTVTIGSSTQDASLTIGNQGGNGTYNLNGGTLTVVQGYLDLGRSTDASYGTGSGQLNVSGGLLEIQNGAYLALGGNSSPTVQGAGVLTQTGGTIRIDAGGAFYLTAYGTGTYNLDGGTLQVGGTGLQARFGAGVAGANFNFGGGTIQVYGSALTTDAAVNLVAGTSSTIDTNGLGATFTGAITGTGSLVKTGLGDLTLDNAGNSVGSLLVSQGQVDQTGGTLAITNGSLGVAQGTAYNLDSGILQVGGANGITGGGTLNLGGGTLQVTGSDLSSDTATVLVVGTTSTIDTGAFNASLGDVSGSGSLNKGGMGELDLGGTINLGAGGTITSVGDLAIGTVNATGSLTLGSGSSAVISGQPSGPAGYGLLQIGYGGTGTLNLSGGTIDLSTLGGNLAILRIGQSDGNGNAGHGTANFSSGSITMGYAGETDGNYGTLVVGEGLGSTGVFNQSGGTVTGNSGAFEIGVAQGTGTYAMTNNASVTMGVGSTIYVGDDIGGSGLLHISGNSTFTTSGQTFVGTTGGTGTILQDGAGSVVNITSGLHGVLFGWEAGSTGNYDLLAGTLNFTSGNVNFGDEAGSTGNLNQSGGTLNADTRVTLGSSGTGIYNISAGTGIFNDGLTLGSAAGSLGEVNQTGGLVTIAGGNLNLAHIYVAGSTPTGSIYNLDGGTLQVGGTNGITGSGTLALGGGTLQVIGADLTTPVAFTLETGTDSTLDTNGFDATLSGVVSGSGVFTKTGLGTAILSGSNTYLGGTIVNGGTLQAGNASAFGTGALEVDASGTADLHGFGIAVDGLDGTAGAVVTNNGTASSQLSIGNGDGSGSYAGAITDGMGSTSLVKNGTGTELLSGANTYSGGTLLTAGTLAVGSAQALGSGPLSQTGGTLETDNINHGIAIRSDFTQTGGTLVFNLNGIPGAADNDQVHVTGQAVLNGNLRLNYTAGSLAPQQSATYTVITTTDGISSVNASGYENLPDLQEGALRITVTGELADGDDDFDVTLTSQQTAFTAVPGANLNPNQQHVAAYLDRFDTAVTSGPVILLLQGLDGVSVNPQALGPAFDQLTPLNFAHFASSTAFNNQSFLTQQFDGYLANHRAANGTFVSSAGGIDYSGLTYTDPDTAGGLQQIRSRLLAWSPAPSTGIISDSPETLFGGSDMKDAGPPAAQALSNRWNTFISGNVVLAQDFSDATSGSAHSDDITGSVQLGADYRITPHFLVGAMFSYGHTDATLDANSSSATIDTYSPGVYASYANKGWYANAMGSYGFAQYNQHRNVSIGAFNGTANSSPGGNQIVGDLDGGYDFHHRGWTYGPTLGVQYVHLNVDGYNETGLPGANLDVDRDQADSLRSNLGGRVSYAIQNGGMIFTPHASASWQHEFLDQSRGITSQFDGVGAGSFLVNTANPSRDSALVDVGFDAQINRTCTVFTDYMVQAGQDNYFGQSIQAGMKISF